MTHILRLFAVTGALLAAACGRSGDDAPSARAENGIAHEAQTTDDGAAIEAFLAWKKAKAAGTVEGWNAFLDQYPKSGLAEDAARRRRILELEPIKLNVEVKAPEGMFMVQPLALNENGEPVPSGTVSEMPAGTTMTLTFTATENGEKVKEVIEATYESAIARAMVFRTKDGLCLTRANLTGAVSYCKGEEPAPPDPADARAMMVYAWLVAAYDF